MLEQITHHHATRRLVDISADEKRPPIGRAHGALGELAADQVRLLVVAPRNGVPDLLLAGTVGGDGERHQLLQRHAVLGIDVEQLGGYRGEAQALLHHGRVHKEPGRNLFIAEALLAQCLEGAELIEGM